MQALVHFKNGLGAGLPKADAVWRGDFSWRVFLFPNEGVRQIDVQAKDAASAIQAAWAKLRESRK